MPREYETDTERKSCETAEVHGWQHVKLDLAKKDWPDRAFFGPGRQLWLVEFKRKGMRPRKRQQHVFNLLQLLGHPVSVIDNYEDFVAEFAAQRTKIRRAAI